MKIKATGFRPVTIILETREEAEELAGVLNRVYEKEPEITSIYDALVDEIGAPMGGLYKGDVKRGSRR